MSLSPLGIHLLINPQKEHDFLLGKQNISTFFLIFYLIDNVIFFQFPQERIARWSLEHGLETFQANEVEISRKNCSRIALADSTTLYLYSGGCIAGSIYRANNSGGFCFEHSNIFSIRGWCCIQSGL